MINNWWGGEIAVHYLIIAIIALTMLCLHISIYNLTLKCLHFFLYHIRSFSRYFKIMQIILIKILQHLNKSYSYTWPTFSIVTPCLPVCWLLGKACSVGYICCSISHFHTHADTGHGSYASKQTLHCCLSQTTPGLLFTQSKLPSSHPDIESTCSS